MKTSDQQLGKSAVDIDNDIHQIKLTFISMQLLTLMLKM